MDDDDWYTCMHTSKCSSSGSAASEGHDRDERLAGACLPAW